MPSIAPRSHPAILLTSGGFIGTWIADYALRAGYRVRLAVRSTDKGDYYRALFGHYPAKTFEPVVVPDLQTEHAYDQAVQGVQAVIHTASPMTGTPGLGPKEAFIDPAVKGTANVLHAVAQHGADVQRVVVTSTIAATGPLNAPGTERDWNEKALAAYEKDPVGPARMNAYIASKILAEKAAWDWFSNKADSTTADLVSILPSWVFGPFVHRVKAPEQVPSGVAFHRMLLDGKVREKDYLVPRHGCVDVRDVAEMHLKALQVPEAGGHRYVVSLWWYRIVPTDSTNIVVCVCSQLCRPGSYVGLARLCGCSSCIALRIRGNQAPSCCGPSGQRQRGHTSTS